MTKISHISWGGFRQRGGYDKGFYGNAIEEVKDEYNESKVSFHITEENEQGSGTRFFDIDLEALILVEDKIWSLTPNVTTEYYEVTSSIYKSLSEQFDLLTEDIKHIKTLK